MYTFVQQFIFDPQVSAPLLSAMETELTPLLRKMPDFVAYYWLDDDAGAGAALCMSEDQAGAEASLELTTAVVAKYATVRTDPPQVIRGKVKLCAVCTL